MSKTVRQNKRARNKASRAAALEMQKVEKYRNQDVINEAINKSNIYTKSVQDKADTKDWSDRKRARVENKKGIELGNKSVYYTKGALESEGFKVSDDGKTVSNPDNLDFKLPVGTQTTNINKKRFRNTYTVKGEYKGTRKRPFGPIGDKKKPTDGEPDPVSKTTTTQSVNTLNLQRGIRGGGYNKSAKAYIRQWKSGKTSPNQSNNKISEPLKKAAEELKLRDRFTSKGRDKITRFYDVHQHSANSKSKNSQYYDEASKYTTTTTGKNKYDPNTRTNVERSRINRSYPGGK